jgi:hypothetical protein
MPELGVKKCLFIHEFFTISFPILSDHMLWNDGTLAALQRHWYRKFETTIPRNKRVRPRSQFLPNSYIRESVSDLHIPRIGSAYFAAEK